MLRSVLHRVTDGRYRFLGDIILIGLYREYIGVSLS